MKYDIAVYKFAWGVMAAATDTFERSPDAIRISNIVSVEFVPRDDPEIIRDKVDAIEREIETIRMDAMTKIENLKQQKAELLALTHQ